MTQEIHLGPVIEKLRKGVIRRVTNGRPAVVVDIEETDHFMATVADIISLVLRAQSHAGGLAALSEPKGEGGASEAVPVAWFRQSQQNPAAWYQVQDDERASYDRRGSKILPLYESVATPPAEADKLRPETDMEHAARDMREGAFPARSERRLVPDRPDNWWLKRAQSEPSVMIGAGHSHETDKLRTESKK